ncbi:DMT family transporter [Myceligenerans pegani]|uniref:DMT family transporter n=1 Tax=Myceligenerans pegani TaxID=2776917 RepID=A0ABR9N175_9MICO|nr:EamA family transporter [Myceligenerans sp. TRM 65318]MBE1877415.1 DMT family transporter [Myceligenerans sp. TRM 65318]MBE3019686.1 DMT family transporter [Myceligenerans sp. TRM 65318]
MVRIAPALLVILWSSGFVGAALAAQSAPAETTLLWRYAVAAPVMVLLVTALGRRYPARYVRREAVLGILGQVGYLYGVFRAADAGLPAGTTALVASLQPALVAVVLVAVSRGGRWHGGRTVPGRPEAPVRQSSDRARSNRPEPSAQRSRDRTAPGRPEASARRNGGRTMPGRPEASSRRRRWFALAAGFAGVVLTVGGGTGGGAAGVAWAASGMLSLAAATVLAERWPPSERRDVLDSLAVQSVVALVAFGVLAVATGRALPPPDPSFWPAVAWLVVLAFAGGYGAYLWVLRTSGAVAVSAWLYLTPAVSAAWGWLMFDDALSWQAVVGFAVALAAVLGLRTTQLSARARPSSSAQPSIPAQPLTPAESLSRASPSAPVERAERARAGSARTERS